MTSPEGDPLRHRFVEPLHPALAEINRSLEVDRRLWREELEVSSAHAEMLGRTGILSEEVARRLREGLRKIGREWERDPPVFSEDDEDIHMAVERRLVEILGSDGKRLHVTRSRNDLVATDLLLHMARFAQLLARRVRDLQRILVERAAEHANTLAPAFSHLQRAQPATLGFLLLAWVEMLEADRGDLRLRLRNCPLGAGAGTGTSFPIDRNFLARRLGFEEPAHNAIAAVSSRREAAMHVASLAALATTLSRLGGEWVLWCSHEFAYLRLGDSVTTGSSIMPQKRNPDGAELLRAQAVRVTTCLQRVFEIQRGLPLGYSKDLQEDKVAVFEAEDVVDAMLEVAIAMAANLHFDTERLRAAVTAPAGHLMATELADHLVRQGLPFREAHGLTARLVREAEARGTSLKTVPSAVRAAIHPALAGENVERILDADDTVRRHAHLGGPAPSRIRAEVERWREILSRSAEGSAPDTSPLAEGLPAL